MAQDPQLDPARDPKGENPQRRFGNEIDDDSADSFPASDPPSFSPVTSASPPKREDDSGPGAVDDPGRGDHGDKGRDR